MKLNKVILEDYGLYRGRTVFDLAPRKKNNAYRPIILFGGNNGAGKTTFLDAIRLGFYGKASLGSTVSQRVYEQTLLGLIHNSPQLLIQPNASRVSIEFDFSQRGSKQTYYIERSWSTNGNGNLHEFFRVRRKADDATPSPEDGNYTDKDWPLLRDVQEEHWQAFITDIVPERLAQLFFFDGEKIKRIAEDLTGTASIETAINSLLSLDLVKRLQADLSIYKSREARNHASPADLESLKNLENKRNQLQHEFDTLLGETIPEKQKEIDEALAEQRQIQTRLNEEGSVYALQRDTKNAQKSILLEQIQHLEKQIREICENAFPLSLTPKCTKKLLDQLDFENELRKHQIVNIEIRNLCQQILLRLQEISLLRDDIKEVIEKACEDKCGLPDHIRAKTLIHDLSENEDKSLRAAFDLSRSQGEEVGTLSDRLDKAVDELRRVETELQRAPEQEALHPLFEQIQAVSRRLGEIEAKKQFFEDKAATLQTELTQCNREIQRLEAKASENAAMERRFTTVKKAQNALDLYLKRLTEIKISSLRHAVAECFNRLAHKSDLVHEITIHPTTFEVTLHDRAGREIHREKLSAGEKQILAVSILWGLARTAGRPLPVIIDTPLGRLDSRHRLNLIQNYFPNAGRQVVLLSTDTEVDQKLFAELKPNISHCYHLHYDSAEGRTYAKQEYFWEKS